LLRLYDPVVVEQSREYVLLAQAAQLVALSGLLFAVLPLRVELVVGLHQLQLDVVVNRVQRVHLSG